MVRVPVFTYGTPTSNKNKVVVVKRKKHLELIIITTAILNLTFSKPGTSIKFTIVFNFVAFITTSNIAQLYSSIFTTKKQEIDEINTT